MLRMLRTLCLLCCLPLVAAACSSSDGPTAAPMPEGTTFAAALNVDLATMTRSGTGLYYRDLTVGQGAVATRGRRVAVAYTGWLTNGTQFDTRPTTNPIEFSLGTGWVIAGWDEGIQGMRVGGRRQLVIPPGLAYGAGGSGGGIPPNAPLVFVVELMSVQ